MSSPQKDRWTVVAPIAGVELDAAVNFEFRVNRLTLVSTDRLPGRRRRFGFPLRLSEMRAKKHGAFKRFFNETRVAGIVRCTGTRSGTTLEREVITLLQEELAILSASQLGYAKRRDVAAPAILGEKPVTRRTLLWVGQSGQWNLPRRVYGPLQPLRLNSDWVSFQRQVFLFDLLKILRGEIKIDDWWRQDLRRAAILVGMSQAANSVPDAFLWNMIALELLLTSQHDGMKVKQALPTRAEALLGWSTNWTSDNFEDRIRHAYELRCRLVHQGDRNSPTREDLYFTDDLLLCLLANLVTHPQLFVSKDAVVQFSKRVEAEKLLGVAPSVRPKSLRMFRRHYQASDYDIY